MAPETLGELAVVVLAYGHGPHAGVVRQVLQAGVAPERVVVVHNPRTPGEEPVPAPAPGVEVVPLATNRGYAAGMNAGLARTRASGARRTALLTHDVAMEPGALAALADAARSREVPGLTGPRLRWLDPDGRLTREQHGGWWRPDGSLGSLDDGPGPALDPAGRLRACDHLDGSALVVDHEVLERVGGLDERFFLYFEETDWCLRASAAGLPVACVPAAAFSQATGAPGRPGAFGFLWARNHLEVARRHGAPGAVGHVARTDLALLPVRRLLRPGTPTAVRRAAAQRAVGHLAGLLAYAGRRAGPPPPWLPGMGDVAVRGRR